jgi:hypothetical protein
VWGQGEKGSWWNKADFGLGALAGPGVRGRGLGSGGWLAGLVWLGAAGLDFLEGGEGAVEGALDGVDAALETLVGGVAAVVGLGDLEALDRAENAVDVDPQELRLEGAEAALEPLGGDEGIDQGADFGSGGLVAVMVFGGEEFEGRGIFAGDDLGLCVDAGLEGIEADSGLALWRARAGRFLSIESIGFDLS